ncbi:MAG: protein-L-isoaspartate O-methyltransferase, partial [Bacteroidota bacterium]
NNVEVRIGDGYHGWPEKGPFDAIMVTAGAQKIPQALVEQLKEGGSIIIPVGASHYNSQLVLGKKVKGKLKTRNRMPVSFVPFTRDNDSTKN